MKTLIRLLIKLALIAALAVFALVNYRYLSFDNGWSITDLNNKTTVSAAEYIDYIPTKVEYYKKTISTSEYEYKVFIETNAANYLFDATADDISALNTLGILSSSLKADRITPIPFYVELVIGLIILIIPAGKKKKTGN